MTKRRYRWKRIFGLVFTLAVIGIGSAPFLWTSDGKVIPGVTIHGTKAGGATEEELKELFSVKNADLLHGKLLLTKGDVHEEISYQSLSVRYDEKAIEKAMALGRTGGLFQRWCDRWRILLTGHSAAIDASFDEKRLTEDIAQLAAKYAKPPVNANPHFGKDGSVSFDEGRPSMKIDEAALQEAAALQLKKGESGEVEIPATDIQQPNMTKEAAKEINAVLAEYTTTFYAGGNRSRNIEIAANSISGRYIAPGASFSYNQATGSRSSANGYLEAPVIINGKVEPGTGGGVCQVSTTLFNAVILSGLAVTERTCHYSPASYAPIGRDATVAEGSLDFCFLNHLKHGVYVYAVYEPGAVTVRILGNQEDKPSFVEITQKSDEVLPFKTVTRIDPSQEEEKKVEEGHEGHNVLVTQSVKWADGRIYHDSFFSDYEPIDTVITYKVKPDDPPQPSEPPSPKAVKKGA